MSSNNWAAINYLLNRFCPYGIILFLLFTKFEPTEFQPYCITAAVWFLDRYSFVVGHSMRTYENNAEYRRKVDRELEEDG